MKARTAPMRIHTLPAGTVTAARVAQTRALERCLNGPPQPRQGHQMAPADPEATKHALWVLQASMQRAATSSLPRPR